MPEVTCRRCGNVRGGFEKPPFPGAIGARILEGTCPSCWGDWLKQQTMLINHNGLDVMDPQARKFLMQNMDAFLFRAGAQAEVDTTKRGTIDW